MATKVTKDALLARIAREEYSVWPSTTVTLCMLTLDNGWHVLGESSCLNPEEFDAELGRKIAFDNAFDKAWGYESYLAKEQGAEDERARIRQLLDGVFGDGYFDFHVA